VDNELAYWLLVLISALWIWIAVLSYKLHIACILRKDAEILADHYRKLLQKSLEPNK